MIDIAIIKTNICTKSNCTELNWRMLCMHSNAFNLYETGKHAHTLRHPFPLGVPELLFSQIQRWLFQHFNDEIYGNLYLQFQWWIHSDSNFRSIFSWISFALAFIAWMKNGKFFNSHKHFCDFALWSGCHGIPFCTFRHTKYLNSRIYPNITDFWRLSVLQVWLQLYYSIEYSIRLSQGYFANPSRLITMLKVK